MNRKMQWLRNKMLSLDLQGMIVSNPVSIRYLTNIKAEGMLLATRKENIFITDGRYIEDVHNTCTIFMIICIMILFQIKVNASILSTDKEVNSGDGNVTIVVTSTDPLGAYTLDLTDTGGLELVSASGGQQISSDNKRITGSSTDGITSLGNFTFKVPTVTQDTTYNIKFSAHGMETTNLDSVPDASNTAVVKVKAPEAQTPPTNPEQPSTPNTPTQPEEKPTEPAKPTEEEKSSEARLSNLGIRPNDFTGFTKNKYEYDVEVPNDVSKVEVYANLVDSKAKIQSGTGNVELKEGANKVEVVVVAEDGKTKHTYTLNITRKTAEEEIPADSTETTEPTTEQATSPTTEQTNLDVFGLSSLTIAGLNINPKFKTTTYEYTAGLTEDLSTLEIDAKPTSETGTVEIFGNENLQQGENTITIVVSDTADAEKSATYQLTINKNYVPETVEEVNWLNPSTWGLKQYVIIGTLIVLIIIVVVAIIFKVRLSRMDEDDDIDFPGVEELDKALTEHQELTNFDNSIENNDDNEDDDNKTSETREKVRKLFDNDDYASTSKKKGKHF